MMGDEGGHADMDLAILQALLKGFCALFILCSKKFYSGPGLFNLEQCFYSFFSICFLACNISRKVKEKIQSFKNGKSTMFATEVVFCAHEYNQKYNDL